MRQTVRQAIDAARSQPQRVPVKIPTTRRAPQPRQTPQQKLESALMRCFFTYADTLNDLHLTGEDRFLIWNEQFESEFENLLKDAFHEMVMHHLGREVSTTRLATIKLLADNKRRREAIEAFLETFDRLIELTEKKENPDASDIRDTRL